MIYTSYWSQNVQGPFKVYVSVQGGNPNPLFRGSYAAFADEGRHIDVRMINIVGPLILNPASYNLTGPPCPTYDTRGRRTPENPVPPNTQLFRGGVFLDSSRIPEPGTLTEAEFTGKDFGYWTRCSENRRIPYDSSGKVKINIYSLWVKGAQRELKFCKLGDSLNLTLAQRFPTTARVTFQSLNGKVLLTPSEASCWVKSNTHGLDQIVITISGRGVGASGSTYYRDTVKVIITEVKFTSAKKDILWKPAGQVNLKSLLTSNSDTTDITFEIQDDAGSRAARNGMLQMGADKGYSADVIAKSLRNPSCSSKIELRWVWFALDWTSGNTKNDGEEAPFTLVPVPADADPALLNGISDIEFKSEHVGRSWGNPGGHAALTFETVNAGRREFKIKNAWWFANQADECNTDCDYRIMVNCKSGGVATGFLRGDNFTVDISSMNGEAGPTQLYTGEVRINFAPDGAGGVNVTFTALGTFARNIRAAARIIDCPAASQFNKMISDEENYHVGQIEGRNGVLCAGLWDVNNIWNAINGTVHNGANRAAATAVARAAFNAAITAENTRSSGLIAYPQPLRCRIEAEAKRAVRASHRFKMACAYPRCP